MGAVGAARGAVRLDRGGAQVTTHITGCLRVYECDLQPGRFGRDHDGGYVLFMLPVPYDAFLSGGVCGDNSFERAVLDAHQSLACSAFDPAGVDGEPHERYAFHADPVPPLWNDASQNALVKLDIEGGEWEWLRQSELSGVAQLVIELHSPHLELWDWACVDKICDTHVLVHAHGNNWDGIVDIDGVRVPGTLETTWVRRDLAGPVRPNTQPIPGPLDMPNRIGVADHVLDWAPFVGWKP